MTDKQCTVIFSILEGLTAVVKLGPHRDRRGEAIEGVSSCNMHQSTCGWVKEAA